MLQTNPEMRFNPQATRHSACPTCGGAITRKFTKATSSGDFDIDTCQTCTFTFVNPTPSHDFIVEHYSSFGLGDNTIADVDEVLRVERDDPNSTLDAARMADMLQAEVGGGTLLDIGCGYGLFAAAARERGFEVDALEIASVDRKVAATILGFEPQAVTFEDFWPTKTYDAAILSQVLEHAREPKAWLEKLADVLRPGGVAAIGLPNFGSIFTDVLKDRDPFVTPPTHLNYFTAASLRSLAERTGFAVIRIETVTRMPKRAFTRRFGNGLGGVGHKVFTLLSGAIDAPLKGTMLNAYLRRR